MNAAGPGWRANLRCLSVVLGLWMLGGCAAATQSPVTSGDAAHEEPDRADTHGASVDVGEVTGDVPVEIYDDGADPEVTGADGASARAMARVSEHSDAAVDVRSDGAAGPPLNGWGRYAYPSGARYDGEFVEGKRHGIGTLTWPDGAKYVGEFVEDRRTGKGSFFWPSGARYEGEFLDGKRHGEGIFTRPDGAKYVGHYRHGHKHGPGIAFSAERSVEICQKVPKQEPQVWAEGQLRGMSDKIRSLSNPPGE